jgi:hypothetical protein
MSLSFRISVFFLCILLFPLLSFSQENPSEFAVDLTIRPRAEFRNGAFTVKEPSDQPAFFISQRTRLRISYGIGKLRLAVAGQNIRVWGESGQVAPNEGNNTMFNEAWAEYEFLDDLSFKLGRQDLVYDDDRILGSLDWHQAGRWHDLVLLKYEPLNHMLHAGLAYSQDGENILNNFYSAPGGNYKTMQFIWYQYLISESYKFSALFLNTGFQVQSDSTMAYMQTAGGNLYKTGGPLTFTGTFYFQTGKNQIGRKVDAWMASFYGGYRINSNWMVHAGTDYLTGNDMNESTTGETKEFVPLYGTNHKFYGLMDYFYTGVPHNQVGLWDKYAGFSWIPSGDFSLKLTGHFFDTGGMVYAEQEMSSYLGTEFDLTYNWNISRWIKLIGGYSHMFPTESMEIVKGRGNHTLTHDWIWTMLAVDVRIFEKKGESADATPLQ